MSWFHRHAWKEAARTFVDPVTSFYALDHHVAFRERTKHVTGFTVVLFKCDKCNKFRREEMQGRVHQPKVVPLRKIEGGQR